MTWVNIIFYVIALELDFRLCAFRAFVCFARDILCIFSLPLYVRDWLQLVVVALPGYFFYRFKLTYMRNNLKKVYDPL